MVLGFDLGDDYSQISCFNREEMTAEPVSLDSGRYMVPTLLCKQKQQDAWYIGEEAYRHALLGDGILIDKLVMLALKEGYETIEGIKYSAEQLLEVFLIQMMDLVKARYDMASVKSIVFSVQSFHTRLADMIFNMAISYGIARENIHVISHSESFLYYVLSQKREIWNNQTALFDLADGELHYYEMKTYKGLRPQVAEVSHQRLEEGFSLEVLEKPAGEKMADQILLACSERLLQKKIFSSVILTGKGFQDSKWAVNFMKYAGNRRKLFVSPYIFAMGAAYKAYSFTREMNLYPYISLCEGNIPATVAIDVKQEGRDKKLVLAAAGENWYEAGCAVELVVDDLEELDFHIQPATMRHGRKMSLSLKGLPKRPAKATRIQLTAFCENDRSLKVKIQDLGFGDLFSPSGAVIKADIPFRI